MFCTQIAFYLDPVMSSLFKSHAYTAKCSKNKKLNDISIAKFAPKPHCTKTMWLVS